MFKKCTMVIFAFVTLALLSGCATPVPTGALYTQTKSPVAATANVKGKKEGKAVSHSYFSLVAVGDSSIKAAAKNGGITKISYVDYSATNVLGLFGTYTTTVYGQ